MYLIVALFVICFLYVWWTRPQPGEPPIMPGHIPLIGHAYRLLVDTSGLWEACKDLTYTCMKKGGVIYYCIGPMKIYGTYYFKSNIFLPFGVETMGPWGSDAKTFIKHLSKRLVQVTGDQRAGTYLGKRVSLAIQRGNVASILGTFPHGSNLDEVFYIMIADPDDCVTAANTCMDKDAISNKYAGKMFGNGLLSAPVPIWKHHRKVLNPAFNQQVLDSFIGVFNKQSRKLVKTLSNELGKPLDLSFYLRQSALETICLTAIGLDISDDTDRSTNYVKSFEAILTNFIDRFKRPWLHFDFIYNWTSYKEKHDKYTKVLLDMSNDVLQRRRNEYKTMKLQNGELKKRETKFKPLMDLIFELEEGTFTDKDTRDEVYTIILAGHESTGAVLTYTFLLIASYEKVQEKIVAELEEVLGKEDRDITKQDLSRLVYLEAVIKESMRFYPISPFITRFIDKDVQLKNYKLRSGHNCALMLYGVHRHPMWGEDAEEFRPERWLDPSTLPANPNAFLAFGAGKRNCIGKVYAMMSMKIILSHVLRSYRVSGDHTKMKFKLDVMLKPLSGHEIKVHKRI